MLLGSNSKESINFANNESSTDCIRWHDPVTKHVPFKVHSALHPTASERKGCSLSEAGTVFNIYFYGYHLLASCEEVGW